MNTAHFHRQRARGIGGSDVAGVLGLSPYENPLSVWLAKTGQFKGQLDSTKEEPIRFQRGRKMERMLAEEWLEERKAEAEGREGWTLRRGPYLRGKGQHRWAVAHPDFYVLDQGAVVGIVEVKTSDSWNEKDWGDDGETADESVPIHYQLQLHHYQWLRGLQTGVFPQGWFAVGFGLHDPVQSYPLDWDPWYAEVVVPKLAQWWHVHVVKKTMPDLPGLSARTAAQRVFPNSNRGEEIELPPGARMDMVELRRLRAERRQLLGRIAHVSDRIKLTMGEATEAFIDGEPVATWRADRNGKRRFLVKDK